MNHFIAKSSNLALVMNGKPFDVLRKWHVIIDSKKMQITVRRRNWHFISFDEQTFAFKTVRNVKIDTHLFGANVSIKVYAGEAKIFFLSKTDAKTIKNILLDTK